MYRVGWWEKKLPAVEIMCSSIFFADQFSNRKNHIISTIKCTGIRQLKQLVQRTLVSCVLRYFRGKILREQRSTADLQMLDVGGTSRVEKVSN
jgi:hypothetical protein